MYVTLVTSGSLFFWDEFFQEKNYTYFLDHAQTHLISSLGLIWDLIRGIDSFAHLFYFCIEFH